MAFPVLVNNVPNVKVDKQFGCATVFENEKDAELAFASYTKGSKIICCGGFYNAVWSPYDQKGYRE